MKLRHYILPVITASLLSTTYSIASPDSEPAELFITAGIFPAEKVSIPGSKTLSKKSLESRKAKDFSGVVETDAGLYLDSKGGNGGLSSIYLRGSDPNYTTILVDGIKVNDPTNARGGGVDFTSLSHQGLGRIEIYKGANSSIYGTDALAGVLNIISQRPDDFIGSEISLEAGFYEEARGSLNINHPVNKGFVSLGASANHGGTQFEDDRLWRRNARIGFEHPINGELQIRFSSQLDLTDSSRFPDDSGGRKYSELRQTENKDASRILAGLFVEGQGDQEAPFRASLTYLKSNSEVDSPGIAPGSRDPFGIPASLSDTEFERYTSTLAYRKSIHPRFRIELGAEHQLEKGTESGSLEFFGEQVPSSFDLERNIGSVFTNTFLSLTEALGLQSGIRIDFPESFSTQANPSLTLTYDIDKVESRIFGKFATGYKLPSFYALGNPIVGNQDLASEKSKTWEVGIESLYFNKIKLLTSWFLSDFKNAIDFDEGPPPSLVNRSSIQSQGFELNASYLSDGPLKTNISLAYVDSQIENSDEKLRNRPDWRSSLGLAYKVCESSDLFAQVNYVGKRFDSSIPNGDLSLADYLTIDLNLQHEISKKLNVWVALDNLTNETYEHYDGVEAPGITARVGLSSTF